LNIPLLPLELVFSQMSLYVIATLVDRDTVTSTLFGKVKLRIDMGNYRLRTDITLMPSDTSYALSLRKHQRRLLTQTSPNLFLVSRTKLGDTYTYMSHMKCM